MDGRLPHSIMMHSFFRLIAVSIKENGLYAVNVIRVRQIMLFSLACFVMSMRRQRWTQNIAAEVDMFTIAPIVCHVIQEALLIKERNGQFIHEIQGH